MKTEKALFKVVGMYCTTCKPIVEKQLKDEKAVKNIKATRSFTIKPTNTLIPAFTLAFLLSGCKAITVPLQLFQPA